VISKELIQVILNRDLDDDIKVLELSSIAGGCIHNAQKVKTNKGLFFIKLNKSSHLDMFKTEFSGLELLAGANEIDVPTPISNGIESGQAYLMTSFVDSRQRKDDFWIDFGQSLALLHKKHQNNQYGLSYDNYIGRLDQYNNFQNEWIPFFISQRLEVQLKLAYDNGYVDRTYLECFSRFCIVLPDLLPEEPPSLLHGDLWSGNFMTGEKGQPVVVDPAVYYGNREIELSFTRMFGGFDALFYRTYHDIFPLAPGFDDRVEIYNLYPHLVHVNMFGGSYLNGVTPVLRKYT
jgi:fructosamine-3-kinase